MIRVLHVVGGMNRAGAETMLMNLYRAIDRTQVQFDFLIYSSDKQDYEDEINDMGGKIHRITITGAASLFHSIFAIRKLLRCTGQYAAIHCHTLHNSAFALLACLGMRNIRKIMHSHSSQNDVTASPLKRVYERATKGIIRCLSDVWLACGIEAGCYLFGSAFPQKGKVLPNGIMLERFRGDFDNNVKKIKSELGVTNELIIGSVARLEQVKNHTFMLDVAHVLAKRGVDFKLVLVGRGSLQRELMRKADVLGLKDKVVFLGVREDIPALLHTFDVFFMPSLFEGLPVCLVEAQACELPCVISSTISSEADLGAGLILQCSLEQSAEEWAEALRTHNRRECPDSENVDAIINESGYNVSQSARYLQHLYQHSINECI